MYGSGKANESLNRKVLVALTVVCALFLLINLGVHRFFVNPSFVKLEYDASIRDLKRSRETIEREVLHLTHMCSDWAVWDDAYRFLGDHNSEFVEANIIPATLESNSGVNLLYMFDLEGKAVIKSAYAERLGGLLELEDFPSANASPDDVLLRHNTLDSRIDGIWNTTRGIMLLSSCPVVKGDGSGPIRGTLIMGSFLDKKVVEELGQQANVCFHATNLQSDRLSDKQQSVASELLNRRYLVEELSEQLLQGYTIMNDIEGTPTLLISADLPRDVTAQGRRAIAFTRASVVILSAALLLTVYFMIKKLVLARLARINRCVAHIEATGDLQIRSDEHGSDELGHLATTLNRMLTRLQQYENSIQESEKYHRMIFRNAGEGMVVMDANDNVLRANDAACRMHGYSEEELIGLNATDLVSPECHARLDEMKRRTADAPSFCVEMVHRRKDQTKFDVEVRGTKLSHASGRQTLLVMNDITDRLKAQADLEEAKRSAEQANMAKTAFLANMSHEIRTPMTAVLGYAEYMLQPSLSDLERTRAVQNIQRQSEHLLTLIDEILDVSKSEAGALDVRMSRCSPLAILAEIYSIMLERATVKGIALKFEYMSAIPESIYTDPIRLKQILINLTGNAVKFTDRGGVRVAVRYLSEYRSGSVSHGPGLQFDIIDSGIGLSPQQLDRLFEPFSQVDPSTTRQYGGLGLGLIICKRLAALLGGEIIVDSQLGYGSTFRLRIPTHQKHDIAFIQHPAESMVTSREKLPAESGPTTPLDCRVLLAEDGPDNQRLISFMLRKAGADVTVAENGRVAIDRVFEAMGEGFPFDAILMDMQMPVLDGYQATMELRQRGFTGPIIAVTAHAMHGDREKCIRSGCDDYVTKPVERSKLIASIQGLLAMSYKEKACAAADRG